MMNNLIRQEPPTYKGCPQPPKNGSGLLAQLLCYLFGGGTPAYKGKQQPVAKTCGVPGFPGAPAYKTPEPVATETVEEPALDDSEGDDPVSAKGPITIVIG